ncbi:MAG: hypothetical protein LUQ38_12695 [Methanotrichaceae archaeon]|nr:hypothetical protein [Methanotrichaceae archaeon]
MDKKSLLRLMIVYIPFSLVTALVCVAQPGGGNPGSDGNNCCELGCDPQCLGWWCTPCEPGCHFCPQSGGPEPSPHPSSCPAGTTPCRDRCCEAGQVCSNGRCVTPAPSPSPACPVGTTPCRDRCCEAGQACSNGRCVTPAH